MDLPLVSVIVPVYKVELYLDRCIQSIVNQTYSNLEIILVDDGSPDNCPALCDAWTERDDRIQVVHKPNGGLSDARNAGMATAKGEIFAFVDSDDWIATEMIERLVQTMERDDSDIAACSVEMVWEDGSPSRLLTAQMNGVLDKHQAQAALLNETSLKQPVWYKIYRKETIENIWFEVGKYHEDVFWSYQAVGNARRVSLIDYVGYHYLQRRGSIMGEGYSHRRLDAIEAFERRYTYFCDHFPELAMVALIKIRYACIYHGQMTIRYLRGQERAESLRYLKSILQKYPISGKDYISEKLSHRIWLQASKYSLPATCRIKNFLHIGF